MNADVYMESVVENVVALSESERAAETVREMGGRVAALLEGGGPLEALAGFCGVSEEELATLTTFAEFSGPYVAAGRSTGLNLEVDLRASAAMVAALAGVALGRRLERGDVVAD